jgi:phosphoribosylformylglycinamidine synthase PurS subunit
MLFEALVEVSLKPGHSDPEGETTAHSLRELSYQVVNVKVGKTYTILLKANSEENAKKMTDEICRRLLTNPTKDAYTFKVVKSR